METTKMIVIKSKGYVETSRGRVYAPIRNPYRESVKKILHIITVNNADVWEVLPDKTEVKLTATNYDKNNSLKPTPVVVTAPPSAKEPIPDIPSEATEEIVSEPFMEDLNQEASTVPPMELGNTLKDVEVTFTRPNPIDALSDETKEIIEDMADDLMNALGDVVGGQDTSNDNDGYTGKKHGRNRNKNKNRNNKPVEATIPEEVE